MAIITCPECGQKISSTAQQCVHCGCKITVCSECGKVLLGEPDICSECGYPFKKEMPQNSPSEKSHDFKDVTEAIDKWKSESIVNKLLASDILFYLSLALFAIPTVMILINSFSFLDKESVELFTFKSELSAIKTSIIFCVVFDILTDFLEKQQKYFFCYMFYKWTKEKNIDLKKLIEKSFDLEYNNKSSKEKMNFVKYLSLTVRTMHYAEDRLSREKTITIMVVYNILSVISKILLWAFLYSFIEYIYSAKLFDLTGNFDLVKTIFNYKDLWLFLIPIAMGIIKFFVVRLEKSNIDAELWFKKNIPNAYTKYFNLIQSVGIGVNNKN